MRYTYYLEMQIERDDEIMAQTEMENSQRTSYREIQKLLACVGRSFREGNYKLYGSAKRGYYWYGHMQGHHYTYTIRIRMRPTERYIRTK